MKKILSLILTMLLSTSFAFAGSSSDLKQVFDEFQYEMTVEWDQKDEAFKNAATEKLNSQIVGLQAIGLSNDDLLVFAQSEIMLPSLLKDVSEASIKLKSNLISQEEYLSIVNQGLEKSQKHGANWTDEAILGVAIGAYALIIIVGAFFHVPLYMSSGVEIH